MNIEKLRSVGRRSANSTWYKEFCKRYDTNKNTVAMWLKKEIRFQKYLHHTDYYPGKPGPGFRAVELYSLRFPEIKGECVVCGNETRWSPNNVSWHETCSASCASYGCGDKKRETNLKRYGVENPSQAESVKRKRRQTFIEKYGVDNPWKARSVKRKIRETTLKHYGVENASQSEQIKEKKRQTFQKHYGHEHWTKDKELYKESGQAFDDIKLSKGKQTCLSRYGVENPAQSKEIQKKIRATNLKKYGCNPGAIPNGYKIKSVFDKFGNEHLVQGYETKAIEYFSRKERITRIESRVRHIPRYRYKFEGSQYDYHPDLLVETQRGSTYIIEVKSEYTLILDLEKNLRKFKVATRSCLRKGYSFWLLVFHQGKLLKCRNPTCLQDLIDDGIPVFRRLA